MVLTDAPTYFDVSWSVISTIGLNNVFVGLMVAGITGRLSNLLLVPIVVSAACALANGLCYIAYIGDYSAVSKNVAIPFSSLAWLVQEAGLPLYGYMVVNKSLRRDERIIYQAIFWTLMLVVVVLRIVLIVLRMPFIVGHSMSEAQVNTITIRMSIAGFVALALAECASAVFLLKRFQSSLRLSKTLTSGGSSLFRYVMRSTEVRVCTLVFIGITRAATFSFYSIGSGDAKGLANQLDRFVVSLQALFPIIMLIDVVASRLAFKDDRNGRSRNLGYLDGRMAGSTATDRWARRRTTDPRQDDVEMLAESHEHRVDDPKAAKLSTSSLIPHGNVVD